ncbi:two component transcriptional regulator, LuxR family [Ruaniaceae bacterium KH17]|nr:two component transcriptional regulator, LuxR family [Ruaniaceae bacterium KH17]
MRRHIGIVDDHPAVVLGATSIIGVHSSLFVSGTGATVAELLEHGSHFDLVLLDLTLRDGSRPAENVRTLTAHGIPVIIFTSGDEPRLVREAARAGAMGMVLKTEPPQKIISAIVAVLRGEVAATTDWAAALDADEEFVSAALTDRETEVLALYAAGETAERVARQLFISRETVLDHIRRIRSKYTAIGRTAPSKLDLYHRAVEDGILPRER